MTDQPTRPKSSVLKVNKECPPAKEINILLLGQTGVGKTTFINSFANYLVNNTLDEAIDDNVQVIIPSAFSFTDPETFEQKIIKIGHKTNREQLNENGQSCTQQCRSFIFPIGNRNLRLIDTPGMGDTRGSEQDNRNLFEILTYISHYEHLNGICVFLKPNEERLTISFRLCIKQVLHYLHPSARENIIFIFTNARSTFFMPGSSKKLLQVILNEYQGKDDGEVPFSKDNTYLLDNEPFRYLVLRKNRIQVNDEQSESYRKSWDHTMKQYERLIAYINERPLHAIANTLSLNEAEQLIRKLSRPIAETLRLIQQNIHLARKCKQDLLKNQQNTPHELFQNIAQINPLQYPSLICISEKCLKIVDVNKEEKVVLYQVCQEKSSLRGVIQETISDSRIAECDVIDNQTDKCTKCGCSWKNHMHITYEYHTDLISHDVNSNKNRGKDNRSLQSVIDKRISDLQEEQATIENTYKKLSKFLHINAIHPFDDDIVKYLQVCIRKEQMKQEAGVQNDDVIGGLSEIMVNYQEDMDAFMKTLTNEKDPIIKTDMLQPEDTFLLVGTLYRLHINGQQIRHLVDILKMSEETAVKRMEKDVKLPEKAASSKIMEKLRDIISSDTNYTF